MAKEIAGFKFIVEKGFHSELPSVVKQSMELVEEVAVVEEVQTITLIEKQEEIDIPEFMKEWSRNKPKQSNVIQVDFPQYNQEEEEEEVSLPEKIVDETIAYGKKLLRPLKNYFFGGDE
jgi:hypothetical protein